MNKRCSKCGRSYQSSLAFMDPREVKIAHCRVCPANRVFAVCANCADVSQVQASPCPWCGSSHMWTVEGMVPAT